MTPFIAVKLSGDGGVFTAHLNHIPGTNGFQCLDLLEAAAQIPNLQESLFDQLELSISPGYYKEHFKIDIVLDVE
ncbi:MAG: hypothetical protein U0T11_08570 [Chitinophagaceae bacterium]